MTKPARYMLLSLILLIASCMALSYVQAQELPDPVGPIIIPTRTPVPAPTPSDGDNFVIMWHVVYLPFVEVDHAP